MKDTPANFVLKDLLDGSETYKADVSHRCDLPPATVFWYRADDEGRKDPTAKVHTMWFTCPCGCGQIGACPVRSGGWSWNGSLDTPTLAPSILLTSGCRWHGYLTDGVFRQC